MRVRSRSPGLDTNKLSRFDFLFSKHKLFSLELLLTLLEDKLAGPPNDPAP